MKMLLNLYKFKIYRTLKNGFLLDFFLKRFFFYPFINTIQMFNYYFNDKYIIEHSSKQVINSYLNLTSLLSNIYQKNAMYSVNYFIKTE